VFHLRALVDSWLNTVGAAQGGRGVVFHAFDSFGHEILWPLFIRAVHTQGLDRPLLEGIGGGVQYDYQDPLLLGNQLSAQSWADFWPAFYRSWRARFGQLGMVELRRLTVPVLSPYAYVYPEFSSAPYIAIPSSDADALDAILKSLGAAHRHNVRRRLRQAEQLGEVRLETASMQDSTSFLQQFFSAHVKQWDGTDFSNQFTSEVQRRFFERLVSTGVASGKVELSRLTVCGSVWHWLVGLLHRGVLYWYKPTYVREYSSRSPGLVHLAHLVQKAPSRGIARIDLGYGDEHYKLLWTRSALELRGFRMID
jgi:CelD/BcsL family acetyltransferase involved in cellulose biosynthesis